MAVKKKCDFINQINLNANNSNKNIMCGALNNVVYEKYNFGHYYLSHNAMLKTKRKDRDASGRWVREKGKFSNNMNTYQGPAKNNKIIVLYPPK